MALIQIEDGVAINPANIESVEQKGQLSSLIIMQSGNKHIAQIPYKSLFAISNQESGIEKVIRNIDNNTARFSG